MENENAVEEGPCRKRKIKFSDKELEILIEEVTARQEQLFGKLSLKVPDSVKRNLWIAIQSKVNAVGVAHRDINNPQKRWYDLRSRAKEKLAKRMKSAKLTGGGTPRDTPSTPLEEMVESTLLSEAVVGVTNIDTSEIPTPTEEQLQELIEQDLRDLHTQDVSQNQMENAPSTSTANSQPCERQRVRQLLQTDSETEQNVNVTPSQPQSTPTVTNPTMSRRRRLQQFTMRRTTVRESGQDGEGTFTGNHVEDNILKVQRLQGKDIRIIKCKMGHISKQMGTLASSMNTMINVMKTGHDSNAMKLDRIANSLETMCTLMQKHQKISAKRQVKVQNNMQAHNREMTSLTNCIRALCKQTLSTQVLLMKTFKHIQKGVESTLDPSDKSQSMASPEKLMAMEEQFHNSAESGTSEHCLTGTRRSIKKQNDATNANMHTGKSPGTALGVRGHKK
ncbi:uncharacterized protein LOC144821677 [Lissotriton helveticus]